MTADVTIKVIVPVVETDRLILREPRESDFETVAAFAASDRTAFIGGKQNRYEAWRGHLAGIGHWIARGYGFWMVEDKASGKPAGRLGFIYHAGWSEPELGWHIYDGFEGRGYAFEGAMAARQTGARRFGLDGVISHIDHANLRSRKLAERMGATIEREAVLLETPVLIYRHPKVLA
ncbi:N-acetyltransferase [Paracoccus suum]|uniref:N-acetyltransferase n=1 Tax=Paracoccus suum TaxID=2259340 RepID=A0A344PHG9_9RHOB|nr:GNAT family N-acetyltransferase [Paracoccus suum]AXC48824.1 N-acetyltransferase [Paracoccus suum]